TENARDTQGDLRFRRCGSARRVHGQPARLDITRPRLVTRQDQHQRRGSGRYDTVQSHAARLDRDIRLPHPCRPRPSPVAGGCVNTKPDSNKPPEPEWLTQLRLDIDELITPRELHKWVPPDKMPNNPAHPELAKRRAGGFSWPTADDPTLARHAV